MKNKEMKVKELRMGNIVSHEDYSSETFKVVGIELDNFGYLINTKGGKNGFWINYIDLITKVPITKDWLLKFGFYHNEQTNIYYWGSYLQIGFSLESLELYSYSKDFSIKYHTFKTKYVHELQNLCFELEKNKVLKLEKVVNNTKGLPY